ncbi:MAG TPA: maleylacetoacetate isomerase [Sphingobium sp.]
MSQLVLHGYWRSSASYRLRIALNFKGIAYGQVTHDLRKGEQRETSFQHIAPHGLVPAIEYDGRHYIESPAILEWIEAQWPEPRLLPRQPQDAVIVRSMMALIACDIHPLNNLRVLDSLRRDLGADDAQVAQWIARWTAAGFTALETLVSRHGGRFAFGDSLTFADCCLVPQLYNAERFGVDLSLFPHLVAAGEMARTMPVVAAAAPSCQPDAD